MADKALATCLTALVLAVLAVWIPFLETIAWFTRPRPSAETLERADRLQPLRPNAQS